MIWLQVTLTSKQRVSLGQGGERAFLTTSHPIIPGSVIRGALAAAWVTARHQRDIDFREVFENSRFGPLIPDGVQVAGQSVSTCKYHRDDTHSRHHDEAFLGRLDPDDPGCRGREYSKGGYVTDTFGQPSLVTITTTALEPRKHVASKSELFSRQAIERGTAFTGFVVIPDECAHATLRSLDTVFVGGRSSVLGRCSVEFKQLTGAPKPAAGTRDVVLRTASPALLVDQSGAPSVDLKQALEDAGLSVQDVWANRVESNTAGGWHAASGLPKPMEIAVAPGATALLRNPDMDALTELLDHGIGLRRSEGYGWLEALDTAPPAHRVTQSVPTPAQQAHTAQSKWMVDVGKLALTPQQTQWLAGRLRHRPEGYNMTTDDFAEPGAERLASPQQELASKVIRGVPQDQRNSLAFTITKGSRK